jgi:site-specific DNA-cytosine methylase
MYNSRNDPTQLFRKFPIDALDAMDRFPDIIWDNSTASDKADLHNNRRRMTSQGGLRTGSVCSGINAHHTVLKPFFTTLDNKLGITQAGGWDIYHDFPEQFMCDINPDMQEWTKVNPEKMNVKIVHNMQELLQATCRDRRTGDFFDVGKIDYLDGSTTCKEASTSNSSRGSHKGDIGTFLAIAKADILVGKVPFENLPESSCLGTGITVAMALSLIVIHGIPSALLENLWTIMAPGTEGLRAMREFLHYFGWTIIPLKTNAKYFLVPQDRKRGYMSIEYYGLPDVEAYEANKEVSMTNQLLQYRVGFLEAKPFIEQVTNAFGEKEPKLKKFRAGTGLKRSGFAANWITELTEAYKLRDGETFEMPRDDIDEETRAADPGFHSLGQYPKAKVNFIDIDVPHDCHGPEGFADLHLSWEWVAPRVDVCFALQTATKLWIRGSRSIGNAEHHWALQGYDLRKFPQFGDKKRFSETKLIHYAGDMWTSNCYMAAYAVHFRHSNVYTAEMVAELRAAAFKFGQPTGRQEDEVSDLD